MARGLPTKASKSNVRLNHRHERTKSNRLRDLTKRYQDTASTVWMSSKRMRTVGISSFTLISADSTSLKERKTDHRNGITLKHALVAGRYDEQGTTRMHLRVGLPKKQTPAGKPQDRLT